MTQHKSPLDILDFWFGPKGTPAFEMTHEKWFKKDSHFDTEIKESFGSLLDMFSEGGLTHWQEGPWSTLALILLLDQFPRNIFRQDPQAFHYDGHALQIAKESCEKGFDQQVPPLQRIFYYLPLEHSEDLVDQKECVRLFTILEKEQSGFLIYAEKHLEIIERFGRFPHRNETLGRHSTPEEEAFLKTPGSSF